MASDPRRKRRRSKHKRHQAPTSRSAGQKGPSKSGREASKPSRQRGVKPTSSFSSIKPSSAPVSVEVEKEPPAVWRGYLLGLAGVALLMILGGGHNVFALSLSLLLPGVALLYHPPIKSPGVWLDRLALAFMAILLLSLIPPFYWPEPEWRNAAEETFGINLPASLSVQPWASFEAWVLSLAGLAWFYAASSWEINHQGRRWFFFAASGVVGLLAVAVLSGNTSAASDPLADSSAGFSLFPDRKQAANLLVVGGVAAFGYAMCGLRNRRLLPLLGVIAAVGCFWALAWDGSSTGLPLIFSGMLLGYFLQLATGRVPKRIKLSFALILVGFAVFLAYAAWPNEGVPDSAGASDGGSGALRVPLAKDTWTMIRAAPLTGHGLGTYAAVFPQYRDQSASAQGVGHPGNDFLWFAAESGIPAAALLLGFLLAYLRRCRGLSRGPGGGYRLVALAALLVFLLHGLVDVSGHRPGAIYFAILLAVLALPQTKVKKAAYGPRLWRWCGGFLVAVGSLWALSGLTGLPLHSAIAAERYASKAGENIAAGDDEAGLRYLEKWIDLRPLDWRAYFERAVLTLSRSEGGQDAAADFMRARFVEPNRGAVALEEGFAWIPYDPERAIVAWREVFSRKLPDPEQAYQRMLDEAENNDTLMAGLARLSRLDQDFRVRFLSGESGDYFTRELARELEEDGRLARFSRRQRTAIVENWIERGEEESAEKFLRNNESRLDRPWWLWSLLRKEQANFEEAVRLIRTAITPPDMPESQKKDTGVERLQRGFAVAPGDLSTGTALLQSYLEQENFREVNQIAREMIEAQSRVPGYVTYWHAESFFQLGDYIESWYAFEQYLEELWDE